MAIVKEIRSGSAVVRIDDSCCRGISPEEAALRWAEVERAILTIDRDARREFDRMRAMFIADLEARMAEGAEE